MTRTNAMRLLDLAGISYTVSEYEYDPDDLNGMHAAERTGMPPEEVFKTLVARNEKGAYLVFCVPVCCELDLKKAAQSSGSKKIELIHVKELLPLTGYIRGGCSPVGMKKDFPAYIDETCVLYDKIGISAGARGCQLLISAEDLIQFRHMETADITK